MYERAVGEPRRPVAGLVALGLGLIALAFGAWQQFGGAREILQTPDPRVTLPLLGAAVVALIASLVRRERWRAVAIVGVALASAAAALGWVVLVAAVAAGTVVLLAILHQLA